MRFELVGTGYLGRSAALNASRMVNFYPELSSKDSKNVTALIGTPGTSIFCDTGLGVIRGLHAFDGVLYIVASNKLYSVSSVGVLSAQLGSNLATSSGRVVMADNGLAPTGGNQLCITDGTYIYIWNVITSAWNQIGSPTGAYTVCFIGGYFVVDVGTGSWQVSGLYNGLTWSALDKSTADAAPDSMLCVFNNHNELWLFGEYTTEIWYQDVGHPPFKRQTGGVIDYGLAAQYTVAKGNNNLLFLANIRNGDSGEFWGVAMTNCYGVQKVSTPAIDYQISQYSTISDAFGFCYTDGGHEFYMLTFPTANATWCYDTTTSMWHERSAYQGSAYATGRHISNCYALFAGNHYVGDWNSGKIYQLSSNTYSDSGTPIASFRTSPYLQDGEGLNNLIIRKVQVDAEMGVRKTNRFVAISYASADSAVSSDGSVWTGGTLPVVDSWEHIAWNGNVYCAIAYNSYNVATSPDGINWTLRTTAVTGYWNAIAWNGSVFLIIEDRGNRAMTSPDGITWTLRTMSYSGNWQALSWNGTVFCAIENTTSITTSDFVTWHQGTMPNTTINWSNLSWSGSVFCAIAYASNAAATSSDGLTWHARTLPVNDTWKSMTWNGNVFYAIVGGNDNAASSPDGINWTSHKTNILASWDAISWNGAVFCLVPTGSSNLTAVSNDGTTWQSGTLPTTGSWMSVYNQQIETQPYYPVLTLSWSDDNGHTWSADYSVSLGIYQAYTQRAIWRRLGITRGRIFRLSCVEAINKVLIAAHIDAEKAEH